MRKSKLFGLLVATLFMFTSCEKESLDIDQDYSQIESIEGDYANGQAGIRTPGLPTTIDELRDAGINVSPRIASIVNNDLDALLAAAALSANPNRPNRRALRQLGFRGRQIRNVLPRINRQFLDLVASLENPDENPDENPAPGPDPVDPGVILQLEDLNLSADANLALSFGSAQTGSITDAINNTIVSVSTNSFGLFSKADDGVRIINQNGLLRTRVQFEQQILDGIRFRFGSTAQNSVSDFDAVVEEFRPLAANAADNLFFLLCN